MSAIGSAQRLPDRLKCPIRDRLETDLYSAIHILAMHSSRLVDVQGTGEQDQVFEASRHCEEQRLLIRELEEQIASHRAEHGC